MDTYAVLPCVADRRYLTDDGSWHTAGTLLYHIWVRQMNERIRELAEQCYHRYSEHNIDLEKFAELIVRECVEQASIGNGHGNNQWDRALTFAAKNIKEHFGVEEQVQDSKELHTCPYREEIHNDYESLCDCDEEQQHQCAMDI